MISAKRRHQYALSLRHTRLFHSHRITLGPNIHTSTLFSNTLGLRFSIKVSDQISHPRKTDKNIFLCILILYFWIANWKTQNSALNDSKLFKLLLISSWTLHKHYSVPNSIQPFSCSRCRVPPVANRRSLKLNLNFINLSRCAACCVSWLLTLC